MLKIMLMLMRSSWLILIAFLISVSASNAAENLDEVEARKSRQGTNTFYRGPDSAPNYMWQPMTLVYIDTTTSHESWRFTNLANLSSTVQEEYGYPRAWSADGKRLALSMDIGSSAWTRQRSGWQDHVWYVLRSDGSKLRPAEDHYFRGQTHRYDFGWSPTEVDVAYGMGGTWELEGPDHGISRQYLYKATVGDTSITVEQWIDFGDTTDRMIDKGISGDGMKGLVFEWVRNEPMKSITILPSGSKGIDATWNLNSAERNWDTYWGDTVTSADSWHNVRLTGNADAGYWIYGMQSGTHTWWRLQLEGSGSDGGPQHTKDTSSPYSWWSAPNDEMQPANSMYGSGNDPWCDDGDAGTDCGEYWSHPYTYPDGTITMHTNTETAPSSLVGFYDSDARQWLQEEVGSNITQHNNWNGWSDYGSSFPGGGNSPIFISNGVTDSQSVICYSHEEGSDDDTGTMQSPDGTKVAWASSFLNNGTGKYYQDVFVTVAYFPYPPEIYQANATGGTVTVKVRWNLAGTTRGYTTRGWPDPSTDDSPPPREVDKFRLWRSTDNVSWIPIGTASHSIFTDYDFKDGTWIGAGDDSWDITDSPGDGTWYYGVTSIEHSGLESRVLSNRYSITISGGSGTGSQATAYPGDPGDLDNPGTSDFYTSFSTSYPELIRYYNVYAQDGSAPSAIQQDRVGSLAVNNFSGSTCSWVDWLGNTGGTTQYVVTAVDTQGNESATNYVTNQSVVHKESPATADGQYTVKWDNMPQAAVVTAALTGTLANGATEAQIVAGGETLIVTLTGDTWVATFGDDNQITTDFIAGLDSGGAEAAGWDAEVKGNMVFGDVARTNDTTATITLGAEASYAITQNETITLTIPASSLTTSESSVVATPTFEITATPNPTAALTGTLSDNATEGQIVSGGETLIITLTNDTWVAAGATFDAIRQDIIDGMDSAQSETTGWNNEVRDKEVVGAVVRTNATTVTITLSGQAAYDISANESITMTIPASALVTSGSPVVATPGFAIIFFDTSTEEIVGMTLQ